MKMKFNSIENILLQWNSFWGEKSFEYSSLKSSNDQAHFNKNFNKIFVSSKSDVSCDLP